MAELQMLQLPASPLFYASLPALPLPPDDPLLVQWTKDPSPFIGLPPPNMNLTGWRDPFVVERPCEANQNEWVVLMGAGVRQFAGKACHTALAAPQHTA